MCFHVCMCVVLFMCVYTRTSVCVYIHVLRMYTCLCVCIRLCTSVCTRVGTPVCISYYLVLSVYTHPSFLCVVSCYPIFHVIKRRPVTQLRLPPAACQGYLSSLRVLSAVSGRQIWALSVLVFQFLVHFTEDSRGAALIILAATSPGGFVFFSVVPILPALFHCCPPNTVTIGRHTPVTYAVLPAYYTVVLWCRLSAVTRQLPRPFCRHITPLYSGAGYRPSHASSYAVLPAYYTVVLWCRLSAVTRQLPMPFCRHVTPLYSGAGSPSVKSQLPVQFCRHITPLLPGAG